MGGAGTFRRLIRLGAGLSSMSNPRYIPESRKLRNMKHREYEPWNYPACSDMQMRAYIRSRVAESLS